MDAHVVLEEIPVIAIDGPSASGKGTVAEKVASVLGFHYLDSGALYRLVALKALQTDTDSADENKLEAIAANLDIVFQDEQIYLEDTLVTDKIRVEACGMMASKLAALPRVRAALVIRQRAFRRLPGLVADGRDMGTVIFPDAMLKVFLTASVEVRAQRRYKQLMEKGIDANIRDLQRGIQKRDEDDANRDVAPLQQKPDARLLDTTSLSILQAQNSVLEWYRERCTRARGCSQ